MPTYKYRFINPSSGRKNTKTVRAYDEDDLRFRLSDEGIEPIEIIEISEPAASEKQIDYLQDLIGQVPPDLSIKEASNLIDNALGKRSIADPPDFEIAENLKVEVTKYASKKAIHEAIFYEMQSRQPAEFASWYAYRVYRNGFDRRNAGVRDPLDPVFSEIGQMIVEDQRLHASFKRIVSRSYVHFRWFGTLRTHDGAELPGDGDKSEVYRFVINELKTRGKLNLRGHSPTMTRKGNGHISSPTAQGPEGLEYPLNRKISAWVWIIAAMLLAIWLTL